MASASPIPFLKTNTYHSNSPAFAVPLQQFDFELFLKTILL